MFLYLASKDVSSSAKLIGLVWMIYSGLVLIEFEKEGLRQVQHTYLGGFGSRGSGKVTFHEMKLDGVSFLL